MCKTWSKEKAIHKSASAEFIQTFNMLRAESYWALYQWIHVNQSWGLYVSLQRLIFGCFGWSCCRWWSVVVVAVCAENQVPVGEKAGAHEWHGAARTLEARLVPLPVLEGNVLSISKPWETRVRDVGANRWRNVSNTSLIKTFRK